jgi:lipopolysaccharide cholinephosphotransferase
VIGYSSAVASPKLLQLQQVLREMTGKLHDYCSARGLALFLVAGSALGAVRHGDIIPWDDDIDFGMGRADFDRLIALWETDPLPGMFLQCWQSEPDYCYSFAKVRLEGTSIRSTDFEEGLVHSGIFVDIFPFDQVPANRMLEVGQRYGIGLLNLFIEPTHNDADQAYYSTRRKLARRLARIAGRLLPGPQRLSAWRDQLLRMPGIRKGEDAKHRTRIGASSIFPPVPARLGDHDVLVPADCDAYLTRMYGDWRKLPPEDQRAPMHVLSVDFGDRDLA